MCVFFVRYGELNHGSGFLNGIMGELSHASGFVNGMMSFMLLLLTVICFWN